MSAMKRHPRVAWVGAVVVAASALGAATGLAQLESDHVHDRYLRLAGPDDGDQRVLAIFPRRDDGRLRPPEGRYPVVVALHGAGEAARGTERAVLGWKVDYELAEAYGALARGRLGFPDFRGFVTRRHLDAVNTTLAARPFRGVMVVSPYTPNLLSEPPESPRIAVYADWIAGRMLAAVRQELPAAAHGRESTGIDGVSLGGMMALEIGFRHPEVFGSVGAIQPAIRGRVEHLADLAARARTGGFPQEIRLLTSQGDPFREPTRALSTALRERRVPHRLIELPGPHDYAFNRGPGSIELLRFHDEVLVPERIE